MATLQRMYRLSWVLMNGNIFLSKKTLWNESKKHMQDGTGQTITSENRQRAVVFGWRESVQKHNRKFQIDPDRGCPGLRGEDPEGDAADDMTSLKAESREIDMDPAESEPWVAGRHPLTGGRGGPRGPEALLAARSAAGPAVRTTQEGSVGEEPADCGEQLRVRLRNGSAGRGGEGAGETPTRQREAAGRVTEEPRVSAGGVGCGALARPGFAPRILRRKPSGKETTGECLALL